MKKAANKFLSLLLLASCAPAQAQDNASGNPPNWCRNGAFAEDGTDFRVARAVGKKGERVYFHGDEEGCPGAKCRKAAYVIPGDELLVSRGFGDWLCAWYQPPRGSETVGWIPAHQLSVAATAPSPTPARWVGDWEFGIQSLKISRETKAGGRLRVEGVAFWRGLGDNIHTGGVSASARPDGNVLVAEEDICRVTLRLVGDYIVATDNSKCGGMNVRFDGVYRRKQARRTPPRGRRSS